jgi:putative DNA primase/helicase
MADQYLVANASVGGAWTLRFMGKEWWGWTGTRWEKISDARMNSRVWGFLEKSVKRGKEGQVVRFGPVSKNVAEVENALRARVVTDKFMPCWFGSRAKEDGRDWVALQNGVLNLRTRELVPHSPRFWNSVVLPFAYEPGAKCERWDRFLEELWPGDEEAGLAVEEMLGVCVSYETRWHKAWFIKGVRRSGKGTLAKVLEKIVGEENFAGMQVDNFSQLFGLEAILAKKVTCFPDVRMKMLHWRAVAGMVVKLLSITGEDKIDVAQKYQRSANSRLSTRLVMMSNESLDLKDETGVVATRFICLEMAVSWLDREDFFLFEKLERELPGIFNKALAALDAARDRGRLTQPKSGARVAEELLRGTDTLIRWMLENTVTDGGAQTAVEVLYLNYRGWMEEMEYRFFERRDRFSERLQGFPGVDAGGRTPRSAGRTRTLRGIRLKDYKDRAREAGRELKKCEEPEDDGLEPKAGPISPDGELAAILKMPIASVTAGEAAKPQRPSWRRI